MSPAQSQVLAPSPSTTADVRAKPCTVDVLVDALIVGRKLRHPVYDQNGILLLAAGTEITTELKSRLKDRGVVEIAVRREDAGTVTLLTSEEDGADPLSFRSELTSRLDGMIGSDSFFVKNSGAAVRDKVVLHGCKAYDPDKREYIIQQHEETAQTLDNMIREAMAGRRLSGNEITTVTATYLTELTADSDNVLTAASEAARDQELTNHCLQMSILSMAIGVEMGLDEVNVRTLGLCGLVHDWGMIRVPEELRKPRRFPDPGDYLPVQKHPIYALELLEQIEGVPSVVPLVAYQVHERPNGTGYPRRRCAQAIHLFAKILLVADTYIHLTHQQSYRLPVMPYAAMECLLKLAARKALDPKVVRALLNMVGLFPIGSCVVLTDGSVGRVYRRTADYTRPVVQRLQDSNGRVIPSSSPDSLVDLTESDLEVRQALPNLARKETALTDDELRIQARR
ncbi:MAG TPA: HD domain-containing protein [Planctomycetaceae bacterium]|nr:HD domain-containing protein [Planctomycetaceae bacterium]